VRVRRRDSRVLAGDVRMSEPTKVDHAAETERILRVGSSETTTGEDAIVHATLALVEQVKRVADRLDRICLYDDKYHDALQVEARVRQP